MREGKQYGWVHRECAEDVKSVLQVAKLYFSFFFHFLGLWYPGDARC